MIKYELLDTIQLGGNTVTLPSQSLPELVHLDDPAFLVMTDFAQKAPYTIHPNESIDHALHEMKANGMHLLLVVEENRVIGLIASEDILGEKPIKFIQQRRIERAQVLVKMIMVPLDQVTAINIETVEHARVGNIVNTLKNLMTHYVMVVKNNSNHNANHLVGLFSTTQISKQLHMDVMSNVFNASVSELQRK